MTLLKHKCPTCVCDKKPFIFDNGEVAKKILVDEVLLQLNGKSGTDVIPVQVGLLRSLIARIQLDRKN
jgi:hypothetical protein